jgi:phage repressor protein C with HTH and peptisase S24 domain
VPGSDPPKVILKSINPAYDTYERSAEEVNIIGRVIWMARPL